MRLKISGALLRFTDYQSVVDIDAPTVEAALLQLADSLPPFKKVLLDRRGRVRATHTFFLNGDQLSHDQLARPVGPSDQVDLVTSISGG